MTGKPNVILIKVSKQFSSRFFGPNIARRGLSSLYLLQHLDRGMLDLSDYRGAVICRPIVYNDDFIRYFRL